MIMGTACHFFVKNAARFALCILLISLFYETGCISSQPTTDPLAGWKYLQHVGHSHFDKAVVDDYWDFIHKLPADETRGLDWYSINEYSNDAGQHAVRIETTPNGRYWEYVLIYDSNNKRIKSIKYFGGRYRS
jgi:hypothetical protein